MGIEDIVGVKVGGIAVGTGGDCADHVFTHDGAVQVEGDPAAGGGV